MNSKPIKIKDFKFECPQNRVGLFFTGDDGKVRGVSFNYEGLASNVFYSTFFLMVKNFFYLMGSHKKIEWGDLSLIKKKVGKKKRMNVGIKIVTYEDYFNAVDCATQVANKVAYAEKKGKK